MRLKVDENLPARLVVALRGGGHDVLTVREPGALALADRVEGALRLTPIESLAGCFAVLTDHKLRIKRPRAP